MALGAVKQRQQIALARRLTIAAHDMKTLQAHPDIGGQHDGGPGIVGKRVHKPQQPAVADEVGLHPASEHGDPHREPEPTPVPAPAQIRSEEHTSELQSLMSISYAVFCLKKKNRNTRTIQNTEGDKYNVT